MADNKKYYYLKLKDNFYDSEEMIILQNMTDGYIYSDILMKLYLRSLKNGGKLMYKDKIPYTPTVLAQVVRHQVGTVEKAIQVFQDLGLIEILDNGAMYMSDIQNFIGESSTEADRKRSYRERIKGEKLQLSTLSEPKGQMSDKCPDKSTPEIEIEIEKEIEREQQQEKEKNDDDVLEVIHFYNNNIGMLTPYQLTILQPYIEELNKDIVILAMKKALENNKRQINYITAILKSWRDNGLTTIADIENADAEFRQRKQPKEESDEEKRARKIRELEESLKNGT